MKDILKSCWIWKGKTHKGYGIMTFDGKTMNVHRVMYILFYRTTCKGMDVHHKCGNKLCYNPTHMILLSRVEHLSVHRGRYTSKTKRDNK